MMPCTSRVSRSSRLFGGTSGDRCGGRSLRRKIAAAIGGTGGDRCCGSLPVFPGQGKHGDGFETVDETAGMMRLAGSRRLVRVISPPPSHLISILVFPVFLIGVSHAFVAKSPPDDSPESSRRFSFRIQVFSQTKSLFISKSRPLQPIPLPLAAGESPR